MMSSCASFNVAKNVRPGKPLWPYRNPLDCFLDSDEGGDDGLTILARRFAAEPFDMDSFRTELVLKLKKLKYQPARLAGNEKSFYEILLHTGVLQVLLDQETLRELWKCILLKKIVEEDRNLEQSHRAVDGRPLQDLRRKEQQLRKDLQSIETIAQRNAAREESEEFYERLERQYRNCVRVQLISTKYKGSRAVLLSGRMQETPGMGPKDEDLATKVAIYLTLKQKLETGEAKKRGLFDILLCQLAELIWAPSDVIELSNGGALYRAIKRIR